MDPLAEKHLDFSPYNYVLNNPLTFYDPDGKQTLGTLGARLIMQSILSSTSDGGTIYAKRPSVHDQVSLISDTNITGKHYYFAIPNVNEGGIEDRSLDMLMFLPMKPGLVERTFDMGRLAFARTASKYINLETKNSSVVFWSGKNAFGESVSAVAENYAIQTEKATLEQTMEKTPLGRYVKSMLESMGKQTGTKYD